MSMVADRPVRARGPVPAPESPARPVPVPVPARPPRRQRAAAYLMVTKPRIVLLLLIITVPAMMVAAGGFPPPGLVAAVLVGGALAAGAANALNCYLDRDIDPLMRRTARRPLPAHTLHPDQVRRYGLALAAVAAVLLALVANLLAAGLAVAAVGYYTLVYTRWLKRTTPHNTVAGGLCGAAPVLIGWAAVTGSLAHPAPWLLFAVVFLWQPPHFYALALRFRDDYARAGIPMLPVVAGARRVTGESVGYVWLTVAASLALWPVATGPVYGVVALAAGGFFLVQAHGLHRRAGRGERPLRPMRLFHASTSYLALLFAALAVDVLV